MLLATLVELYCEPDTNGGCKLWCGPLTKDGYGCISIGGQTFLAHRFAWEIANGPIPADLGVLHKCDVKCCVNTDHHFLGDNADNTDDCWRKRGCDPSRQSDVSPVRKYERHLPRDWCSREKGRHGRNRALTIDQVQAIRTSTQPGVRLAAQYDITPGTVSKIRNRRLWANLPER